MSRWILLGTLFATMPGCVLGRSPTARHVAMAVDGALVVGGVTMAATADKSSPNFGMDVFDSVSNSIQTDLGAATIVAGLVGLVINLALAPAPDQLAPEPKPTDAWSGR